MTPYYSRDLTGQTTNLEGRGQSNTPVCPAVCCASWQSFGFAPVIGDARALRYCSCYCLKLGSTVVGYASSLLMLV